MQQIVLPILLVSLFFNALLVYKIRINKAKPRQESYDCRQLLHDLSAGSALVEVRRIAPAEVFLRSPRDIP